MTAEIWISVTTGTDHRVDPLPNGDLVPAHNLHLAEMDYGKALMEKYRKKTGRISKTPPVYGFSKAMADEDRTECRAS